MTRHARRGATPALKTVEETMTRQMDPCEWEEYRVSCFGRVAVCALLSPSVCVQHSYTLFLLHLNYCHPKRAPYVHVFSPK